MCTIWIRKSTTVNYKIIALSPGDNLWDTLPTHKAVEILSGVAEHSYVSMQFFFPTKPMYEKFCAAIEENWQTKRKSREKTGTWK